MVASFFFFNNSIASCRSKLTPEPSLLWNSLVVASKQCRLCLILNKEMRAAESVRHGSFEVSIPVTSKAEALKKAKMNLSSRHGCKKSPKGRIFDDRIDQWS
jgi:hypothetical protein